MFSKIKGLFSKGQQDNKVHSIANPTSSNPNEGFLGPHTDFQNNMVSGPHSKSVVPIRMYFFISLHNQKNQIANKDDVQAYIKTNLKYVPTNNLFASEAEAFAVGCSRLKSRDAVKVFELNIPMSDLNVSSRMIRDKNIRTIEPDFGKYIPVLMTELKQSVDKQEFIEPAPREETPSNFKFTDVRKRLKSIDESDSEEDSKNLPGASNRP